MAYTLNLRYKKVCNKSIFVAYSERPDEKPAYLSLSELYKKTIEYHRSLRNKWYDSGVLGYPISHCTGINGNREHCSVNFYNIGEFYNTGEQSIIYKNNYTYTITFDIVIVERYEKKYMNAVIRKIELFKKADVDQCKILDMESIVLP